MTRNTATHKKKCCNEAQWVNHALSLLLCAANALHLHCMCNLINTIYLMNCSDNK